MSTVDYPTVHELIVHNQGDEGGQDRTSWTFPWAAGSCCIPLTHVRGRPGQRRKLNVHSTQTAPKNVWGLPGHDRGFLGLMWN